MLVFSKSFENDGSWHIEKRCRERCGKPIEWLLEIIAEINRYLPADWRMTRSRNNFRIQFKADVEGSLVGHSYRLENGDIMHIVDTVFSKGFTDRPIMLHTTRGKKLKPMNNAHKKENSQEIVPNLYFFRPVPENFTSPLFARQYEKIRKSEKHGLAGDQYHRIHPLTRSGLDLARFLWVRWTTNGDLEIKPAAEEYHGKNYWDIPALKREKNRSPQETYLQNYISEMKKYEIVNFEPDLRKTGTAVEYKFAVPEAAHHEAELIFQKIESYLLDVDFTVISKQSTAEKLQDQYLDDAASSLRKAGLALRIREKKQARYLTLKKRLLPDSNIPKNPSYQRLEEEAFLSPAHNEALLRGAPVALPPVRLLDFILPERGRLETVLSVESSRRMYLMRNSEFQELELSLDRFFYLFDGKKFGPYHEIELESKGVPEADMQVLADWFAEHSGLITSAQTKYGRGAALLKARQQIKYPDRIKPVIIDTDCGVDDAVALALACRSPELEVLAVTALSGNVHLDKVIPNIFKVFAALELTQPPPVARGAAKPLTGEEIAAESVHGRDGLGDAFPDPETEIDPRPAWRLICDLARERPQEITLITIGPLTNLALAIKHDQEAVGMLKEIVTMGGVFFSDGNLAAKTEFNIGADPEAARVVVDFCRRANRKIPLDASARPVTLPDDPAPEDFDKIKSYRDRNGAETLPLTFVGLDVTHQVVLRRPLLELMARSRPENRLLNFLKAITAKYMDFYFANEGLNGCYLHDPLAIAYVINPAFLTVGQYIVRVEAQSQTSDGIISVDTRPTRNRAWRDPAEEVIGIAETVEKEAFEEFLLTRIS